MKNRIEIYEDEKVSREIKDRILQAADYTFRSEGSVGYLSVLLTTEEKIQELNRTYRGIDRVTDVLTFPADPGEPDGYTGDIAICVNRAKEQAEEYGHSEEREFSFLTVHGCLHLLGYDHMEENEERVMIGKQKELMKGLGLQV